MVAGALMYGSYLYLFSDFFVKRYVWLSGCWGSRDVGGVRGSHDLQRCSRHPTPCHNHSFILKSHLKKEKKV